jgi:LPXTG-motif cell wall-anchored protein|tara:strand:- start:13182 stop:13688 length:507 start_codon:yes stop_codon:yes gene_type:complete
MTLLMSSLVSATTETINLDIGESFVIRDKNITLVNINEDDEKVVVCVNNKRAIVEDNEGEKLVNGVYVEVKSVDREDARLKIERDCDDNDCECESDCSNNLCVTKKEGTTQETQNIEEIKDIKDNINQEDEEIIVIRNTQSQSNNGLLILGIFILLVIIIFIIIKRKK